MLKLTRKSDYGLIALQHLIRHSREESASAQKISRLYSIPLPLLSKILQKLARSGLLAAAPGAAGGYRLARDPRLINALEVVRSLEGPVLTTRCEAGSLACARRAICTIRKPIRQVNQRIIELLEGITLSDLVDPGVELPPHPAGREKIGLRGNLLPR